MSRRSALTATAAAATLAAAATADAQEPTPTPVPVAVDAAPGAAVDVPLTRVPTGPASEPATSAVPAPAVIAPNPAPDPESPTDVAARARDDQQVAAEAVATYLCEEARAAARAARARERAARRARRLLRDAREQAGDQPATTGETPVLAHAEAGAIAAPEATSALLSPSASGPLSKTVLARFRIPPFLLPIYEAAGIQYGVRWEVLAALNEIETDYGRNVAVSSAGARGWMQFMPSTWQRFGVDANGDGHRQADNPADAIFAAARYLKAAGYDHDVRGALFAYNHAGWYVDSVLARAQLIALLPVGLVTSLTGLAEGRSPLRAPARWAPSDHAPRHQLDLLAAPHAKAVAVQDGMVVRIARSKALGRYLQLRDVYGTTYTYAKLGPIARTVPSPSIRWAHGGHRHQRRSLRVGSTVVGGTVLGRLQAAASGRALTHLRFRIRPAGRHAPLIDPAPILDGWRLSDASARGRSAHDAAAGSAGSNVGQILLETKDRLARSVLTDPAIHLYQCGRDDIAAGRIDRRVLATLAYLSHVGLHPTVSSLRCGHGMLTSSGNVSEHSIGTAVDIDAINGVPILGHQGAGSITEQTIRRLLTLQGTVKPHQIISLMTFPGADNTLSLPDHADHVHVGFRGQPGPASVWSLGSGLRRGDWAAVTARLQHLETPMLPVGTQP